MNFKDSLISELTERRNLVSLLLDDGKIDGRIIGTGQTDYTKDNAEYHLSCNGKNFILIDVPGIEGDEKKYKSLIESALIKAHLVFFVSSSEKKPEPKTVDKIKQYLKYTSKVFALCNVRGYPDAYDFEEDRECLENKKTIEVKEQTSEVLKSAFGDETFLGINSIQGLLAFCGASVNANGETSICWPRKGKNLRKVQENFKKYFSYQQMIKFSQIEHLQKLIEKKNEFYKNDIWESNKIRAEKYMLTRITELQTVFDDVEKNIDSNNKLIDESIKKMRNYFSHEITETKNNVESIIEKSFEKCENEMCRIIDIYIGAYSSKKINKELMKCVDDLQQKMNGEVNGIIKKMIELLNTSLNQETNYLRMSMSKADFADSSSMKIRKIYIKNISDISLPVDEEFFSKSVIESGSKLYNIGKKNSGVLNVINGKMRLDFKKISYEDALNIADAAFNILESIVGKALNFYQRKSKINQIKSQLRNQLLQQKNEFISEVSKQIDESKEMIEGRFLSLLDEDKNSMGCLKKIFANQLESLKCTYKNIREMTYERA
ncbi:GTPase domain-containing protein [Fibrobacter succinogenes]|uniref:G domain-containing protein n=1 Tax=Fibrobacter succinogenes TaxID=833 RepID=A0A380S7A7_FIBSU|nr:GTPase domain-containing protein [Fibrobacter succinogenes]PWJ34780.1 hypothetical protein IE02_2317 [Fibrobacter succinogenes subsp. elongatus]SUQ24903.1 hypothetical protein SAMN05661053_2317 [Fibrobacter succinogenes]